jgi:hypothetical protein
VQLGKGNVAQAFASGAVATGGQMGWLDDVQSFLGGGGGDSAPSEEPAPEESGGIPVDLSPPETSFFANLPVVGSILQKGADKIASWAGLPTSVDVSRAYTEFVNSLADNAATVLQGTPPGLPRMPGLAPSKLPGAGLNKLATGAIGNSMPRILGSTIPITRFYASGDVGFAGGGGDSGGGGAGRGAEIDAPGGVPMMLPEPGYATPGSGGSMGCPMPNVPSLAAQRNAILCALSQKLNVRIRPKDFLGLTRLGPAFLVFAQALGLDANSLLVMLLSSRRRRSRGRGISARDVRTTKRVGRQFRSLQHALSGVAPRHHGHSNVIPFRRRRRRAS